MPFHDVLKMSIESINHNVLSSLTYWTFSGKGLTLTYKKSGYWISIDEVLTAEDYLDWLLQLSSKSWMTPDAFIEFIKAVDAICWEWFDCSAQTRYGRVS